MASTHFILVLAVALISANLVLSQSTESLPDFPDPPAVTNYTEMARYILHVTDSTAMATISTHAGIEGYPFNNAFSVSDGPIGTSSGVPYFYLTELELSVIDLKVNPKASITCSMLQSGHCGENLDVQSPICGHAIYTGHVEKVAANSTEEAFAKEALFTRHPIMTQWPAAHGWFFGKLVIEHIYLLDIYGGAKVIDIDDFYSVDLYA